MANLIMPQRRVKIKEENMSLREELLDLETAVYQVSRGINAVEAMTMGLNRTHTPYADGFGAICDYLLQADRKLREHMDSCLKAI